jgi:hypothetical protein
MCAYAQAVACGWVAMQGIYRRYIVIVFMINTGKYRNVYRDKYLLMGVAIVFGPQTIVRT